MNRLAKGIKTIGEEEEGWEEEGWEEEGGKNY